MGTCFLYGNGFSSLNFRVKAYATEELLDADTPYENTIGVVTQAEITSYVFDFVEPSGKEGMIWFGTAENSGMAFNALSNNTLTIYPKDCKQFISGEWEDKVVKSYSEGEWTPWRRYLFNFGKVERISSAAMPLTASGNGQSLIVQNLADGSQMYTQEAGFGGTLEFNDPNGDYSYDEYFYDLTNYNTLVFTGSMTGGSTSNGNYCGLYVWSKRPLNFYTENVVKSLTTLNTTIEGDRYLDISDLKGKYCIGFGLYGDKAKVLLQKFRLETATIKEVSE